MQGGFLRLLASSAGDTFGQNQHRRKAMKLKDMIGDQRFAENPWDGKYKIPWDEPAFSKRMLEHHLSQDHDLASRRLAEVDRHVQWIEDHVLEGIPSRILDLGCGPGFYSHRLSKRGHSCLGIDFSPASIDYANENNAQPDRCEFVCGDLREADFRHEHDAILLIYGEFNAFPPAEILSILKRAHQALCDGGRLLIEAHTPEQIERTGQGANTWYKAESGLFSDRPHVCLTENRWHESDATAESIFYIVDAESCEVNVFRNNLQGYSLEGYRSILADAGFDELDILPAWGMGEVKPSDALLLILARKR
jgi:SAM-dependent methyltransferase